MKLKKYLEQLNKKNPDKLVDVVGSKIFRIKRRTIRSWRVGDRQPLPKQAQLIERRTKKKVTLAECY